jgi:hypothetical protein
MHMANPTAKFVSAIFVSFLAGANLPPVLNNAAHAADAANADAANAVNAADDCLSGPKGETPQGSHWYYRIDRATKRHCWYLGDKREKLSQAVPPIPAPPAKPISPNANTTIQRSVANARAELPAPQMRSEETNFITGQQASATAAASTENNQRANSGDANTQPSVVASRWPEPSDANSPTSAEPAADNSAANVQSDSEAEPPPAASPVTLAAADSSSETKSGSQTQSGEIQTLLIVIVGALSLAGVMGSAIFRFGGRRQPIRREIRGDRRAIWDSVSTDRPSPSTDRIAGRRLPKADVPRERRAPDDPSARIAEMLAQLSKTAAN